MLIYEKTYTAELSSIAGTPSRLGPSIQWCFLKLTITDLHDALCSRKGHLFQKIADFPLSLIAVIFSWPGFLYAVSIHQEKIMRERRMPVLQWGMLCVHHFSFLLVSSRYISRRRYYLADDRRDHLQYARNYSATSPLAFLAAQAILGCMIAQNLTG